MMNNSDLLGLTPESMFALVAKIWPLQAIFFHLCRTSVLIFRSITTGKAHRSRY